MLQQMDANSPAGQGLGQVPPDGGAGPFVHPLRMSRFQPATGADGQVTGAGDGDPPLHLLGQTLFPGIPSPDGLGTWPPPDLSMDPDPQAEPLMEEGMDISGSVLFDPNLLNMIQFH